MKYIILIITIALFIGCEKEPVIMQNNPHFLMGEWTIHLYEKRNAYVYDSICDCMVKPFDFPNCNICFNVITIEEYPSSFKCEVDTSYHIAKIVSGEINEERFYMSYTPKTSMVFIKETSNNTGSQDGSIKGCFYQTYEGKYDEKKDIFIGNYYWYVYHDYDFYKGYTDDISRQDTLYIRNDRVMARGMMTWETFREEY